jgi:hypothetical protein
VSGGAGGNNAQTREASPIRVIAGNGMLATIEFPGTSMSPSPRRSEAGEPFPPGGGADGADFISACAKSRHIGQHAHVGAGRCSHFVHL